MKLLKEIQKCRECEKTLGNMALEPRPVLQIDPAAKILIAGQAPGIKVHESGIPFNDASGDRLRQWLGVSVEQFYDPQNFAIVPMAFCYPGKGKSGDLPPPKVCAEIWREKVLNSLPNIKLILVIGNYAQRYHYPEHRGSATDLLKAWLSDHVGSSVPKQASVDGVLAPISLSSPMLVPMPHPSPRNNIWLKKNEWFEAQSIQKIREQVYFHLTSH